MNPNVYNPTFLQRYIIKEPCALLRSLKFSRVSYFKACIQHTFSRENSFDKESRSSSVESTPRKRKANVRFLCFHIRKKEQDSLLEKSSDDLTKEECLRNPNSCKLNDHIKTVVQKKQFDRRSRMTRASDCRSGSTTTPKIFLR